MGTIPPLARLRAEAGLSQYELAEAAGLDVTTISDIETGRTTRPTAKTIGALARGLRMSIDRVADALYAAVEEAAS